MPCITAKKEWEILETTYQRTSKIKVSKLKALRRESENLHMKDFDLVVQFSNHIMDLVR